MNISDTKKSFNIPPNIDDQANDLLDKVVEGENDLLNSGDAKFTEEQVKQAQVMCRRDLVLIVSYMRSSVLINSSIAKAVQKQNRILFSLLAGVIILVIASVFK